MSDKDVDAQFADIIAHWDEVASVPTGPGDPAKPAGSTRPPDAAAPEPASSDDASKDRGDVVPPEPTIVWRGPSLQPPADAPDDPDDHFEPLPTAPLPPQEDVHFWGIIVGLVGGPLLLLWLVLFRPGDSGWWTVGALALTVGGFVLLVLRQPTSRDSDDPDDGARI